MRKSGQTTRLADKYIQELFESETVNGKACITIRDHVGTPDMDKHLMEIILGRLQIEHQRVKVECDWGNKKIYIIPLKRKIK